MEQFLIDQIEAYKNGMMSDQESIDMLATVSNHVAPVEIPESIKADIQTAIDKGYIWRDDRTGLYDSRDLRALI